MGQKKSVFNEIKLCRIFTTQAWLENSDELDFFSVPIFDSLWEANIFTFLTLSTLKAIFKMGKRGYL